MKTMTRMRSGYAVLAVVAAALLIAGSRLNVGAPIPPVPSEAAALQRWPAAMSTAGSGDLYTRAAAFAANLEWIPDRRATGIPWREPGTFVTTGAGVYPVELLNRAPKPDRALPGIYRGDVQDGSWLVVAARTQDGQLIWTAGMYGGRAPVRCGEFSFDELQIGLQLGDVYAGAAVLDGARRIVGMVVRCGDRLAIMRADAISRALSARPSGGEGTLVKYGYTAEPLTTEQQAYFGVASGFVVSRVVASSAAAAAGLQPGDITSSEHPENGMLTIRTGGRTKQVRIAPALSEARGIILESDVSGVRVQHVSGSAEQAGLREGDVIVAAGRRRQTETAGILRELGASGPVYVVFQRGAIRTGVLIP